MERTTSCSRKVEVSASAFYQGVHSTALEPGENPDLDLHSRTCSRSRLCPRAGASAIPARNRQLYFGILTDIAPPRCRNRLRAFCAPVELHRALSSFGRGLPDPVLQFIRLAL